MSTTTAPAPAPALPTITVPAPQFTYETLQVAAETVKQFDEIRIQMVESVEVGRKWVRFFDYSGNKIDEVLIGTQVTVVRPVETPESVEKRAAALREQR